MPTMHGLSKTPEYNVWSKMRIRCADPKDVWYFGRGITVCERWLDFAAFYADMGPRPSAAHEIDRKNNDGNYEPENCRWATAIEQANNKRNNVRLEFQGQIRTLPEWSRITGISQDAIRSRLYRDHWSIELALTTPHYATKHTHLTHDGVTRTISEWTRAIGGSKHVIHQRLRHGWTVARAVTEPVIPRKRRTAAAI